MSDSKHSDKWLVELYNPSLLTAVDLKGIYDSVRFQGFDRDEVLAQVGQNTYFRNNPKLIAEAILAVALRGPKVASGEKDGLKLSNGRTLSSMGLKSSGKGAGLTCSRLLAATADLAAYYMKQLNVPKRINVECPGWLQFPSAGSIALPADLRRQHREFAIEFSKLLPGGDFKEDIYSQMETNAYLSPKIKLF
jgi:hypothetical protein